MPTRSNPRIFAAALLPTRLIGGAWLIAALGACGAPVDEGDDEVAPNGAGAAFVAPSVDPANAPPWPRGIGTLTASTAPSAAADPWYRIEASFAASPQAACKRRTFGTCTVEVCRAVDDAIVAPNAGAIEIAVAGRSFRLL